MLTLDEIAFLMVLVGTAIVLAAGYTRWVVGDLRPGKECVKCGHKAVFGKSPTCSFCGAYQAEFHLFDHGPTQ